VGFFISEWRMGMVKLEWEGCLEPLRVFAAWHRSDNPSFLLESADITTRIGEQSLVGLMTALGCQCQAGVVSFTAYSPWGMELRDQLLREFSPRRRGEQLVFARLVDLGREEDRMGAESPVQVLKRLLSLAAAMTGDPETCLVGAFSYDFVDFFEPIGELSRSDEDFPDFAFQLPQWMAVIQHRLGSTSLRGYGELPEGWQARLQDPRMSEPYEPGPAHQTSYLVSPTAEQFQEQVRLLQGHIALGDVFQAVPSRCFFLPCPDPLEAYARLKKANPSPYMFYLDLGDQVLFGSSPETAIKVSGQPALVEIRPIAGTKPRGFNPDGSIDLDLDSRMEAELRLDGKELAEHMMLIDLARNDIARVSKPGTRFVPKLLTVDRYAFVMHLVSYVQGQLREDLDAFHAYVASMNMGTLVGAPKIRAAQLVRLLESCTMGPAHQSLGWTTSGLRGPYGGAVGYFTASGAMDTAIVIRSAHVRQGQAMVRAGAGIVADSLPEEETAETLRKAASILRALGATPLGVTPLGVTP
jgi:anthranilate synthase component 1